MTIRQYQAEFPVIRPLAPAPSFFSSIDPMVKIAAPIAALAATFSVFVSSPVPSQVVVQQTEFVAPFKTKVAGDFSAVPVPAKSAFVWYGIDWQTPPLKTVVADLPSAVLLPLPAVAQGPTGWYPELETWFAKVNPVVHVELSPFIEFVVSVPSVEQFPSGDGPPWHLTPKERKRLEQYRDELAALQQAFDKRHRENVESVLRDVQAAAYGEPEPEQIERIEASILALPQLSKKSLFNRDLKALKASVEQARFEREDEEAVELLLTML